eukprot:Opistho-2@62650
MSYHFTKDPVDETLVSDIAGLGALGDAQFGELVGLLFGFLLQPDQATKLLEGLQSFAEEHGVGLGGLKNVVRGTLTFMKGAMRSNLTPANVKDDLILLGIPADRSGYVASQWKKNLVGLSRAVVGQTLMVNQLLDLEWRFGVTAGTSELRKAGGTFLQLKLTIDKGTKTEIVNMELSLPQFYSFLHEMETAKANIEILR